MGPTTDELNRIKKNRKIVASAIAAALVAATPGVYGAWQSAKQEWKEKLHKEQTVRDKQERDLQSYVKANKQEIDTLKGSIKDLKHELAMTRTQLVSVVVLLSQQARRPAAMSDAVKKLTKPAPAPKHLVASPKRPALKPSSMVRQLVQKKAF
jgi:septal ring factor EnvC (AmiA/AmiB activator)